MQKKLNPDSNQFELGILFFYTTQALTFFKELVEETHTQLTGEYPNPYWPRELYWNDKEVHLLLDNDQHTPESYTRELFQDYLIKEIQSWPGD